MDFSNRGSQPQPAAPAGPQFNGGAKKSKVKSEGRWAGVVKGVFVVAVVVLLVALVAVIGFGGPKAEGSYVKKDQLQAVFLNTGQVYFGNVKSLNSKYVVLSNIYYLQTSSTGTQSTTAQANTNVSLVKLGCELHEPFDQMVINRDQVTFWENLQDGGQVAKAVKTFEQQNPNGQKCADQSSANNASTNVQGSTNSTTTPTTNTTTKKQ